MTEHDHHRSRWPIRRVQDWIMSGFTLSMLVTIAVFGTRAIRTHSRWMDRVDAVDKFRAEFDAKWAPRIDASERGVMLINDKLNAIIKNQDEMVRNQAELMKWFQRRALRGEGSASKSAAEG